MSQVSYLY